ncbi:inovirus-type Gp2 protein [Burkholderia sp. BE17]|uniref:inovirus-type Gp2 protein n=1 Tax=Burkholderia sp. BE17 TaxID=2656644 RepID=UPI00128D6C01|nr:inovirus-type Gp2 protein [Burkholderia sp. BE17]MPV67626.1 inovirus Gp2 family protein [Burkholderia sp. BE17]
MYEINEDPEALEVIARLDERMNLEETDVCGRRQVVIHKGYASRYLFTIEKFVQDIEKGRKGSFIEETARYSGIKRIRELYFGKRYYRLVNEWLERYADIYHYTARVGLFYDVCKELGLIGDQHPFAFDMPGDVVRADGARYMDLFDMLIEKIRERCQSRAFKERERLREANAEKNRTNVLALEEAMFSKETGRSRWLVLSLTLRYKPQFRRWITPEVIQHHRDRFFAARRFNELMSGVGNYVWAIEQGEDTGLHLHVILFYSGEHNHDEHIAKQIGEYWANVVTEGKGDYWNSNTARLKKSYEKRGHGVGVGQINWNDRTKREALCKNLVYLAKSEQYLMIKGAERIRTFGMGQVPTKAKTGRPRIDTSTVKTRGDLTE